MSPAALCRSFLAAALLTIVLAAPALGTAYSWGSATSGDWSEAANWTPADGPPGANPADTATIAAAGSNYTVTLNQSPTISGFTLNSANATFSASGRSMTVNGTSQLTQGHVLWTGSSWGGTGTLINSTDFTVQSSCSISAGFTQNGDLVLRTHSVANPAQLTVANGFTNAGTIELTSSANAYTYLNVTSGALTNAASGLIDFQAGAGGTRHLNANLTNNGTVQVGANTQLTKSSGQYTNNGAFNIAGGGTITMTSSNQQFTQAAGTLTIDGAFDITSATFNYDGGTIIGTPVLTSSILNIGSGGTAPATFRMHKVCTLSGDLSAGQVITVDTHSVSYPAQLTAANGFTNAGTIELTSSANAHTYLNVTSGALTNAAGGLIDFQAGAGGTRHLNANLTNNGTVQVGANTQLTKSSGQYTNNGAFNIAGGGTITMTSSNQQFTQAAGTLTIDGAFDITSATFNYDGGTIIGTPVLTSSILNIGSGGTAPATFRMHKVCTLSGDLSAGQVITVDTHSVSYPAQLTAANGFTNAGTIELTSSANAHTYLNVTSGALTNAAGGLIDFQAGAGGTRRLNANLTNNGTVQVGANTQLTKSSGQYTNNGAFNIAAGKTLTMSSGARVFTQADGTLTIGGAFDITSATFNYDGGTIIGTPVLTYSTLNVGLGGTAPATFRMHGACTLSGDLSAGQVLTADTNSVGAPAYVTATNGFTSAGTIELTSSVAANTYLNVTSGALTNAAAGLIDFQAGAGGTRHLNANLTNNGQVSVGADTSLTKSSGQYTNNGAFNIAGGKTLTMTSSSQRFTQAAGTLTIDGAFDITSATFNYDGGTITGTPVLTSSNLNIGPGGTAPATFRTHKVCTLSGDLSAGQVITADAHSVAYPAQLTAANGFTNAGTIELTSNANAHTYLNVTSGALTNAASGLIDSLAGMGGKRYIGAHFDNDGLIRIDAATFFNKSSGQYANAGTIRLFDNTATFTGSSLANDVAGLITGTGTLTASSVTFINHGTVAPGLSAGILEFVGTYDQSETGLLEFEIGGYTVGDEYDRLAVTGAAALDGLVDVDLINPFIPDPGDRFDVLTATGGITDNGLALAPEDVGSWLLIPPAGGTVLQVEYVPEPGTLALLCLGSWLLLGRRSKTRRQRSR